MKGKLIVQVGSCRPLQGKPKQTTLHHMIKSYKTYPHWKVQKHNKHHIQERQEVSLFPPGDHTAAINRQESMTNMKHK